jgi:hypothetical protein
MGGQPQFGASTHIRRYYHSIILFPDGDPLTTKPVDFYGFVGRFTLLYESPIAQIFERAVAPTGHSQAWMCGALACLLSHATSSPLCETGIGWMDAMQLGK